MKTVYEVWSLRDADELISVHLTAQDARDAREQHLERYRSFVADRDIISALGEISRTRLVDQPPPLIGPRDRRRQASPGGA